MGDSTRHDIEMKAREEMDEMMPSSPMFAKERTRLSFDAGAIDNLPSTLSFLDNPPSKVPSHRQRESREYRPSEGDREKNYTKSLSKGGDSFFDRPPPGPPPPDHEEMGVPRMRSGIPTLPSGKILRGFEGSEEARNLVTRSKIEKTKSLVDEGHASLAGRGIQKMTSKAFGIASEPSFFKKPETKAGKVLSKKQKQKLPTLIKPVSMKDRVVELEDSPYSAIPFDERFVESKPEEQIQRSVPAHEVMEHFKESKREAADDEVCILILSLFLVSIVSLKLQE